MMKKIFTSMAICIICAQSFAGRPEYRSNRYPLAPTNLMELPLGAIKAEGWLLEQLNRQATGLTGHLDEIYPQVVGERNAWIGGDGDCWERGPYWIDGLLPLAYILDDRTLKDKASVWVEAILASQKPDGYFGPDTDRPYEPGLQRDNSHDWWPKMVALKILKQYYMATADERVIPFMTNYFRYQLKMLPEYPIGHWTFWGAQRAGDNMQVVYWLYNITGDKFLLELGNLLHKQSNPWTEIFTERNDLYRENSLHCVNLGQGFKEPAVYYQQSRDHKHIAACEQALKTIRTTFGFPTGLWAGDESVHYGDPTRGSELCTAVEMMYSLEDIVRITGEAKWADHLERVAYNALPTQYDDDFASHQYFQQVNQIKCDRTFRNFDCPHEDTDQIFGELNGYPCCLCNMHQAWPKFTQSLWFATADDGVAAYIYGPSAVDAIVAGGINVTIKEETYYPFDETVKFTFAFSDKKVKGAYFPVHFRIPSWCEGAVVKVNGEAVDVPVGPGSVSAVRRFWAKGDVMTIEMPMKVSASYWYDGAAAIERGPLVYALKMEEKWTRKEFDPSEYVSYGKWYYEVTSDSKWNYALLRKYLRDTDRAFEVVKSSSEAAYPWNLENAPITIKTKARSIDDWTEYRGSAGPVSYHSGVAHGPELDIELVPYGCTTLRIAEFPVR